jgi:RNase P subunit RPR2
MRDISRSIDLPTGEDGLLPRECPHCETGFAINPEMFDENHYLNLRCPECGWVAEFDKFHTTEQVEYAHSVGSNEARRQAEEEIGNMLEDAFSGVKSNDYIEIETSTDDLDVGRENLPSPHLKIETEKVVCSECGFEYAVEQGTGKNANCPVCR